MPEDYYKTLEVPRSASADEVQKAYRKLARKFHPDMNPDDKAAKARFQQVQAAYDVLGDAEKRNQYDQFGPNFEQYAAGAGAHGAGGGGWSGGFGGGPGAAGHQQVDLDEILRGFGGGSAGGGGFSEFFRNVSPGGGAGGRRQPQPGRDLHHEITVPLATAVGGGQVELAVSRPGGARKSLQVNVPAGIEDGKKIRLRGQGAPSASGGPAGDLMITVHIAPHPCFRRDGRHLEVTVPVSLQEAAAGAKVDVPSPHGTVTLTVPPCTSSGRKLRLKGLGVKPAGGEPGDLLAEIQIMLPANLSKEDLAAVKQIDERHPQDPRGDLKW